MTTTTNDGSFLKLFKTLTACVLSSLEIFGLRPRKKLDEVVRVLRGESFLCHVFSVKSVQNLRTFWRTTQNLLILALLCSLYSKQSFKGHLGVEKHIER